MHITLLFCCFNYVIHVVYVFVCVKFFDYQQKKYFEKLLKPIVQENELPFRLVIQRRRKPVFQEKNETM